MYALVDANAFYCSCEQIFRPDWRGKPVIVLSNNDGMIVSMNKQAKALGIPRLTPFYQIQAQCEEKGVIALSSNYELYTDISTKMMQVIGRFAPDQFIYSIDESFLSFHRTYPAIPCLRTHALKIRRTVWKECRLPVCVGLGATLTLAKMANHLAKTHEHYRGVCVLDNTDTINAHLKQLDVSTVWGIGRQLTQRMKTMEIRTAYDLARRDTDQVRREFNIEVERIHLELNGHACKGWDVIKADQKQIFSTRSVTQRVTDLNSLQQILIKHATIASSKAREQGLQCRVMVCFAQSSGYDERPYSAKANHRFAYPTADVTHLAKIAALLATQLFKKNVRFYKIGVGLLELTNRTHEQLDLLNENPSNDKLNDVFDRINHKYGSNTLFLAGQGIEEGWAMKRERLTKQYTTQWTDIPIIKC